MTDPTFTLTDIDNADVDNIDLGGFRKGERETFDRWINTGLLSFHPAGVCHCVNTDIDRLLSIPVR